MDDKTQDRSLHVVLASLLGGGKAHAGRYIHQQPMLTLELGIRAYTRAKVEVTVLWQVGTSANASHQRVHDALRAARRFSQHVIIYYGFLRSYDENRRLVQQLRAPNVRIVQYQTAGLKVAARVGDRFGREAGFARAFEDGNCTLVLALRDDNEIIVAVPVQIASRGFIRVVAGLERARGLKAAVFAAAPQGHRSSKRARSVRSAYDGEIWPAVAVDIDGREIHEFCPVRADCLDRV